MNLTMNTYGKRIIVGLVALLAGLHSSAADGLAMVRSNQCGASLSLSAEKCKQVRAVVLAQNNMIERGILEHPQFRATLSKLGMAEVFIVPSIDPVYQFEKGQRKNLLASSVRSRRNRAMAKLVLRPSCRWGIRHTRRFRGTSRRLIPIGRWQCCRSRETRRSLT